MGYVIVGIIVLVGLIVGFLPVVAAQGMSDEEREEIGHGPKGQGR